MGRRKFSKKAQTHAALSRQRTKRMFKEASRRSGPVNISYLPGYGPANPAPVVGGTKFPFDATINGMPAIVNKVDGKIVVDIIRDDETENDWQRF